MLSSRSPHPCLPAAVPMALGYKKRKRWPPVSLSEKTLDRGLLLAGPAEHRWRRFLPASRTVSRGYITCYRSVSVFFSCES